ncbi:MAG: AMP-binding protein, partial [Gammaproteobacteria bacterium]
MEKTWLKSYPPGMPETIDVDAYRSVTEVFEQAATKYSNSPAFANLGTTLTYAEMDRLTAQLASYLQHLPNMRKGDRVAVMMPNVLQNPVAIFGILRAGFTVVNTNPLYTTRELKHQLTDSGAKVIVAMENFCHTLADVIDETPIQHVITTQLGDLLKFPKSLIVNLVVKYVKKMVPAFSLANAVSFKSALSQGARKPYTPVETNHEDIAFLQYTGGTTGVAKGAMLTHGNMIANMQQASAWIKDSVEENNETIITALPLYHIFSLTANCLTFMKVGARNYLITNPRDMPNFVKELQNVSFTAITGVNTLFIGLMNTPGFDQVDFSHLKLTLGGGMAVQQPVAERWNEITGIPLIEAYGLPETCPAVCINPLNLPE